jgi:sensor histidine kinase YesM
MRLEIKNTLKEIYIRVEIEDNGNGVRPKKAEEMEKMRREKHINNFSSHQSIR